MSRLSTEVTVARLVTERPGRSRVFETLGIDYCCGGNRALAEVCAEKGLDALTVLRMIEAYELEATAEDATDWSGATAGELADHIEEVHHGYLREALPRLSFMVDKVAGRHADRHPELEELRGVFGALCGDLEPHVAEEERAVFPLCRGLDGDGAEGVPGAEALEDALRAMEREHEGVGEALARMRGLTGGYEPPADACNTYRAMLDGLAGLEKDLHLHVHEENNVLFPKIRAEAAPKP